MTDTLKLSPNERVDLADLQYAVGTSQQSFARLTNLNFLTDATSQKQMWVLRGFDMSSVANQLTVNLGSALLAQRDGLNVFYGVVCAEGDAQKGLDLSSYPTGTYNIYIRFTYVDGTYASRIFWSPTAGGSEYAQTVPTRSSAQWELRCEANSPGAEWLKIGQVVASGTSISVTDMRPMYFEGQVDQGYTQSWGSGVNDRSSNRATYGLHDLQTFTQAMRTCLEDIKGAGLRRWYSPDVGGLNVGFVGTAVEDRLAAGDAGTYLQGDTTAPSLHFESNTYLGYSRATKAWSWITAGTTVSAIDISGNQNVLGSLAVGTMASSPGAQLWVGGLTVGSAAATSLEYMRMVAQTGNVDTLRTYAVRSAAGSNSNTVDWFWQRLVDTGSNKGYVGFYGNGGVAGSEGIGLGYGVTGGVPLLFVSTAVGIGFASPASILSPGGPNPNASLQLNATSGSDRYLAIQKAGVSGLHVGYSNAGLSLTAASGGGSGTVTGGVLRQFTTDPIYFAVNGATSAGLLSSAARWYLGSVTASWISSYAATAPVGAAHLLASGSGDYSAVFSNTNYATYAGKAAVLGVDSAGSFFDFWTYNIGTATATLGYRIGSALGVDFSLLDVVNSRYFLRYYSNTNTFMVPNTISFLSNKSQQLWFGPYSAINNNCTTFQAIDSGVSAYGGRMYIPIQNLPNKGTITAVTLTVYLPGGGSGANSSISFGLQRSAGALASSGANNATVAPTGGTSTITTTSTLTGIQNLTMTVSEAYTQAQSYSYLISFAAGSTTIPAVVIGGSVTVSTDTLEQGTRG